MVRHSRFERTIVAWVAAPQGQHWHGEPGDGTVMDDGGMRVDDEWEWDGLELDGGAVVPGVDYEGEWLRARAAAGNLNAALAILGVARESVRAQAGWAADGSGVVRVSLDTWTAMELARLLELVAGHGSAA
jgi:hypothetical protein